ncbi:hypothetical protein Prudu_014366 [Prunus dulcis]|uniref:Inositol polyphosphate multikinase n=1 Tax=Prunus dulcis TaxID=3755 RepID=A0A4Y1RHM5_PRUDU|nr:hypothetical protein Prudu_014366 [Prunus dulcis]
MKIFEKARIKLIHPIKNTQRGSGGFDFLEHVTRYTALTMLKVPDHQVAGHQAGDGKLGPLTDDSGHFYKPLQNDGRGSHELAFYTSFSSATRIPDHIRKLALRKFVSSNPSTDSDIKPDCSFASTVYGGPAGILAQLLELKSWSEEQTIFHFYSCSVLMVYEKEEFRTSIDPRPSAAISFPVMARKTADSGII